MQETDWDIWQVADDSFSISPKENTHLTLVEGEIIFKAGHFKEDYKESVEFWFKEKRSSQEVGEFVNNMFEISLNGLGSFSTIRPYLDA